MHTMAAHAGGIDPFTGAVMPPIYQSSTFVFRTAAEGAARFAGEDDGFVYTRMGNPTVKALEDAVARLEGGWGGLATSTGMAAVVTLFLHVLGQGLHVVGTDSLYGPSRVVLERDFSRFGVTADFVDTADLDAVRAAMRPETRLLFLETPANPTINTFMSPYLQRPFEWGADVVIHSMTKSLNGHSDVVAGMIVTREEKLWAGIRKTLLYMGGTMDPHQAYLVIRGIRTLPLRVEKAQSNAQAVAEFLEGHEKVAWVRFPGLRSHPQYELARRQMRGPGSVISFELRGGLDAGRKLLDAVRVPALAVSLGGVESLIQHPASMTHAAMGREDREAAGITDGLVRFSVGCEDLADLIADLRHALSMA
jgi:methionine-gamma-lyase